MGRNTPNPSKSSGVNVPVNSLDTTDEGRIFLGVTTNHSWHSAKRNYSFTYQKILMIVKVLPKLIGFKVFASFACAGKE